MEDRLVYLPSEQIAEAMGHSNSNRCLLAYCVLNMELAMMKLKNHGRF